LWYTADDLSDILAYAYARGIQAFIEIDMPGHTNSISYSHPELIAASNIQPDWPTYAAQPPSGQLKLNNANVTAFMSELLADVLPRTGGASEYFHSGGDEVNANVYLLDPGVKSNISTTIQPYLQDFVLYVPLDSNIVAFTNRFSMQAGRRLFGKRCFYNGMSPWIKMWWYKFGNPPPTPNSSLPRDTRFPYLFEN
jgi:Glycosyl hydrolase family 20, catalytic domain